jgi:hypothetical protein
MPTQLFNMVCESHFGFGVTTSFIQEFIDNAHDKFLQGAKVGKERKVA